MVYVDTMNHESRERERRAKLRRGRPDEERGPRALRWGLLVSLALVPADWARWGWWRMFVFVPAVVMRGKLGPRRLLERLVHVFC
jgi:hypothetical protein